QPPEVLDDPRLTSLMSVLAAGILAGPAGEQIVTTGDLASFFKQVHKWYGDIPNTVGTADPPPASAYDLHQSRPTHFEAFNVYVPFTSPILGTADPGASDQVFTPPPDFSRFFNMPGTVTPHVSLTGPTGYGPRQFLPLGQALPYTIQFENARDASS